MGFMKKLVTVVGNVGAIVATETKYHAHNMSVGTNGLLDKAVEKTAELRSNHSNRRVRIEEK